MDIVVNNYKAQDSAGIIKYLNSNDVSSIMNDSFENIEINYCDSKFKIVDSFSKRPNTLYINVMCKFSKLQSKYKFFCEDSLFQNMQNTIFESRFEVLDIEDKIEINTLMSDCLGYSQIGVPVLNIGNDKLSGILAEFIGPNIISINLNITDITSITKVIILKSIENSVNYFKIKEDSIVEIANNMKAISLHRILYPKKVSGSIEGDILMHRNDIVDYEGRRNEALSKLQEIDDKIASSTKVMDSLLNYMNCNNSEDDILSSVEFGKIVSKLNNVLNMKEVLDVWIEQNIFKIYTDDIRIITQIKNQKRIFHIGKFLISIDFQSNSVKFTNLDRPKDSYYTDSTLYHHPHIPSHGRACFGNVGHLIGTLMINKNLDQLTVILLEYLKSANLTDAYGKRVTEWDEVNEAGIVINKGVKGRKFDERGLLFSFDNITCHSCQLKTATSGVFKCTFCGERICESCTLFDENNNPYCKDHIFNSIASNITCPICNEKIEENTEFGKCEECETIGHNNCLKSLYMYKDKVVLLKKLCPACLKNYSHCKCSSCSDNFRDNELTVKIFTENIAVVQSLCNSCLDEWISTQPNFLEEYGFVSNDNYTGFFPKSLLTKVIVKIINISSNEDTYKYIYVYDFIDCSYSTFDTSINIGICDYAKYLFHTMIDGAEGPRDDNYADYYRAIASMSGNARTFKPISLNENFTHCLNYEAAMIKDIIDLSGQPVMVDTYVDQCTLQRIRNGLDEKYTMITCDSCVTSYCINKILFNEKTANDGKYIMICPTCTYRGMKSYITLEKEEE